MSLVALNRLSDAIKALSSNGIASAAEADVFSSLCEKHPRRDTPLQAPAFDPNLSPLHVKSEEVARSIQGFKKGTACGRDGLRADHLRSLLRPTAFQVDFLKALTSFINLLLAGGIPDHFAKFLASAPLTALRKPDNGVRPIAVGETYRRLTSRLAGRDALKTVQQHFAPLQVGVSKKGGVEHAFFRLQDVLKDHGANSNLVAMFLDFSNAFNLCSRQKMFDQVRQICPQIAPWVEFCYHDEPLLFFDDQILFSSLGVQQGDPLGPLLFSLVLHPLIQEIERRFDLNLNIWYLDDGTVVGKLEDVLAVYDYVKLVSPEYGLFLNDRKTKLWWPTMNLETLSIFPPDLERVSDGGVRVLGSPCGDERFIIRFFKEGSSGMRQSIC